MIMKSYTAIYSTEALKGVFYSFESENLDAAIKFCSTKFSQYPNIAIVENNHDFIGKSGNEGILAFLNGEVVNK